MTRMVNPRWLPRGLVIAAFLVLNPGVFAQVPPAAEKPAATSDSGQNEVENQAVPEVPALTQEALDSILPPAKRGVANAVARGARLSMYSDLLEVEHLDLAFDLALMSTAIDTSCLECWRLLLAVTEAGDQSDEVVQATQSLALEQISMLDPGDQVVRLRRLLAIIEANDTVEERLANYSQMLEPKVVKIIGNQVAARLALSMAQMLYRAGDSDGFAQRLAQALELDPTFPRASAMAAGYLAQDDDPIGEAELLVAAIVADPLERGFVVQLGSIALMYGSFGAAERLFKLARAGARSAGADTTQLAMEHALSSWGAGRTEPTLRIIESHMRDLDAEERQQVREENPNLGPVESIAIVAPMPLEIALLQAAILSQGDDEQVYRAFVASIMKRLALMGSETPADELDPAVEAAGLLDAAFFAAWQGENPTEVARLVAAAGRLVELSDEATRRYAGWEQIAEGRIEIAIATLLTLADTDPTAKLGLSIALERTGNRSDAARYWLELAQQETGSIIGIWARHQVQQAIDRKLPPTAVAKELTAIIKSLPLAVDRLLLDRGGAYALRIEPLETPVEAFEPILYELTIENRSGIPIAIGPNGPLKPTVALLTTISSVSLGGDMDSRPIVIPIDRVLEIPARGSLVQRIDLSGYPSSELASTRASRGFTIDARAITNFISDGKNVVEGRFGERATARLLRVDGITPDAPWRRDAIQAMVRFSNVEDLRKTALLMHVLQYSLKEEDAGWAETRVKLSQGFAVRYQVLPAPVRAWLALSIPLASKEEWYYPVMSIVLQDEHPVVVSAILSRLVWASNNTSWSDEYIEHAKESLVPSIAKLAATLQRVLEINDNPLTTP